MTDVRNIIDAKTSWGLFYVMEGDHIGAIMQSGYHYEKQLVALVLSHLRRDGVVLDVGANIGTHTIPYARRVADGGGHVHAFEPHPVSCSLLRRNVTRHGYDAFVTVHEAAVGHRAGKAHLSGGDGRNLGDAALAADGRAVDMVTIDDLGLGRCDAIKIDVEGAEALVLAGAAETIREMRPVIFFEAHDADAIEVVAEAARDEPSRILPWCGARLLSTLLVEMKYSELHRASKNFLAIP